MGPARLAPWRRRIAWVRQLVAVMLLLLGFGAAAGCHLLADVHGYDIDVLPQANKVDLLLVVDNSPGPIMADKVTLFELAIKRLVTALAKRVDDLHVGVISTSLGSVGADACADAQNDHGRLMSRAPPDPEKPGTYSVPTLEDKGVLAWAPQRPSEPGVFNDIDELEASLSQIMQGVGEQGCGYEATLEAWYRFLVERTPYATVTLDDDKKAVASGVDETVLIQRELFLRPDSLLMIVVLSDENDCSLRVGGDYYLAAQNFDSDGAPFHLPKPRYGCTTDPADSCCASCGQPPGEYYDDEIGEYVTCDTSADPCCEEGAPDECDDTLALADDHPNLRCYNQKERFGVDFLYPIERYVMGLGSRQVHDFAGNVFQNPIYAGNRDPRLVVYGSLIGVPWQDIARRVGGKPNINEGLNEAGARVGGFQTAAELRNSQTWDLILGDPKHYHDGSGLPQDRLMHESVQPRQGVHPLVPEASIAPSNAAAWANIVNSHEHSNKYELQFTCVFQLESARPCSAEGSCTCDNDNDYGNPICQNPMPEDPSNAYDGFQHFVQAYPGIRHLELMRSLGDRAVVGSICPVAGALPQQNVAYAPSTDTLLEVALPFLVPLE